MPRSLSFCSCIIVASAMFSPVPAQVPELTPPDWTYQSDLTYARLGNWVGRAGDVNGDGYADVIVSAPDYDGANVDEGLVLLFLGSSSGLSSSPDWSISASSRLARLSATEMAGDVNGDGFDDVLLSDGRLFFGSSSGVSWTFRRPTLRASSAGSPRVTSTAMATATSHGTSTSGLVRLTLRAVGTPVG